MPTTMQERTPAIHRPFNPFRVTLVVHMSIPPPLALILLALAPAALASEPAKPLDGVELAQLTIHQRIVIRIPRLDARPPMPMPEPMRWSEKKGPKCVPMDTLGGAMVTSADSIDLLTTEGDRIRARLGDDCPALDFYSGLYLKRTADGMLCAKRDVLRSRSGSACAITGFKRLRARR
jgi:hypothetical protein